jgi:hypothetical protein
MNRDWFYVVTEMQVTWDESWAMRSAMKTIRTQKTRTSIVHTASDMKLEAFVFVLSWCEFRKYADYQVRPYER